MTGPPCRPLWDRRQAQVNGGSGLSDEEPADRLFIEMLYGWNLRNKFQ